MGGTNPAKGNDKSNAKVIDLLRKFGPKYLAGANVCGQVNSVLSKVQLCRTRALKGRLFRCQRCQTEVNVYNSCGDRHCPQCGGARRADWMDKSAEVVLPGVNYFQVIFTLPDKLSALILGNRRDLYNLLFRSAWQALSSELRRTGKFHRAALMVLHTWNQQLDHHPHIHALVPGGGPALTGDAWLDAKHPQHRRRKKPYLTNNVKLGHVFRDAYLHGLKRLLRQGKLKLGGSVAWLQDGAARQRWLDELEATDWNVFIEGPPQGSSDPRNVVKYLARYISGGPIADRRIIKANPRGVTFRARPKKSNRKRRGMNRSEPYRLSGVEFVRRWCLHILPRGFTRCRRYGGYHNHHRADYMARCRKLLAARSPTDVVFELIEDPSVDRGSPESAPSPTCSKCEMATTLVSQQVRPSWKDVFFTASAGRAPPC